MFDIGFGEIFLIAIVALLVLGPERLPKAARFAGLWVRRARAQWYSVKAELENELADEELRRSLQQTRADLAEARNSLAQGATALQQQFEDARADVRNALRSEAGNDAAADQGDDDHEPPLSSVTDARAQGELSLEEHGPDHDATHGIDRHDADAAHATTQSAGSASDARR
ncbi:Sec-independent protein translocase protein TatB [Lysobacter yangpyeongensis]|uniref:Sec-independent protein translocase protein TatB n=1 Tax=Lysobacter yangpyeongensis TaxID=346182 RepID=A0ABW0SR80_9GAMM